MNKIDCLLLDGYQIYCKKRETLVAQLEANVLSGKRQIVYAINPLKIQSAIYNKDLDSALKKADWLIADGIGVVKCLEKKYKTHVDRITGIDLFNDVLDVASRNELPVFIYGAHKKDLNEAINIIKNMFSNINVAGFSDGYSKKEEVIRQIDESKASILIVALGSPNQEIFIDENIDQLKSVKYAMGVGGTLDVMCGKIKRAPKIFITMNIEWLYRMIKQPKRFSKLKDIINFVKRDYFNKR